MEVVAIEQALRDRPGDLTAWRAYADLLVERGDARGELIHLEQRLERTRPADRPALRHEAAALAAEHQQDWDAALPPGVTVLARRYGFATKVAVEWNDGAPALIEQALRERFVTALRITPNGDEEWLDDDDVFDENNDLIPPRAIDAGALADLDLGRLVELDFSYLRLGGPGAEALVAAPAIGRIETLDLRYCGIGDTGAAALAASPHFGDLRRLHLQHNGLTADGVRALHRFERLVELDLRYNRIGAEGAEALLAAPFVGSLTRLLAYRDDVTDAGARRLAAATELPPALRSLWRSA
ncbi:TIGR02996 domain-containing protein [Streptomyces sp. I05A-00742]|uniref:TIGR02996 domain-containing protein n=1 Tax=Streptomyces sp. I05A-00742 TaxID=2732853 RepID=UPI00148981B0|nr:TIGR02996 domain-containing protein [Streptomyces sp. I05A-00742]